MKKDLEDAIELLLKEIAARTIMDKSMLMIRLIDILDMVRKIK